MKHQKHSNHSSVSIMFHQLALVPFYCFISQGSSSFWDQWVDLYTGKYVVCEIFTLLFVVFHFTNV